MSAKAVFSPYGAFEMKASYQRNMLIGNFSVLALAITIVSIFWIVSLFAYPPIIVIGPCNGERVRRVIPDSRIPINPNRFERGGSKPVVQPFAGVIPTMIPDSEYIDIGESEVLGKYDPAVIYGLDGEISDNPATYDPNGNLGTGIVDEIYPGETEFVPFEKEPAMIYNKIPVYPRLCKLAGIEGDVIIKVLVGKDGHVIKALVAKSSKNQSLDDAALSVAMDNEFSPALQNSIPIMLWVTYKVTFKLR